MSKNHHRDPSPSGTWTRDHWESMLRVPVEQLQPGMRLGWPTGMMEDVLAIEVVSPRSLRITVTDEKGRTERRVVRRRATVIALDRGRVGGEGFDEFKLALARAVLEASRAKWPLA